MSADDPRYLRQRRQFQVVTGIGLAISLIICVYVFVQVPLNSTITLHERNSGNPMGLPVFAILIWPGWFTGFFVVALREKPKPIAYWEYKIGSWIAYLVLSAFMAGLIIWILEFLKQ